MAKLIDITGRKYDRLTVVSYQGKTSNRQSLWLCKCECGRLITVSKGKLTSGNTKSCGCLHSEQLAKRNKENAKHGLEKSRLYGVWHGMKQRCLDPNRKEYPYYGGRGITICNEWINDFIAFREWAFNNGYDEAAPYGVCTLDRIDVNGNYEPSNCRFVDSKTQAQNRRKKTC